MRKKTATLIVASLTLLACAAAAQATPTQINVRIEGSERTLFEGPILTEGHEVEASSDARLRSCDGVNVNDPENIVPGPTPTAASVDAMGLIDETFDGQWDPQYEDYFLTRWGPDEQNFAKGEYWGVLVNDVFTNVGGCQYELGGGDEVTWAYNAFAGHPSLALYAAGSTSGARPLTALAQRGQPFEVEVRDYSDAGEGTPPAQPERTGSEPFEGAEVSPVEVSAKGFERPETASPATVTTDAQGKASITFATPGWHRIKATHLDAEGHEDAIRSNRLDVCVPPEGELECGRPPFEDEPRTPTYLEGGSEEAAVKHEEPSLPPGTGGETSATSGVAGFTATTAAGAVRVQSARFDGLGAVRGLIGVSWHLLDGGAGVASWKISSKTLAQKSAKDVTRASGTGASSALVRLPGGRAYKLKLTVTDGLARSTTAAIGNVLVPEDERSSALRYAGQWRHVALAGAWDGGVSQASARAQVSASFGAGRPVFELRKTSHEATVELLAGAHRKVVVLTGGSTGSLALVKDAERLRAGVVSLRVLSGTVDLDGVATEP
jgi:Domain of unknown function (DUF4430)